MDAGRVIRKTVIYPDGSYVTTYPDGTVKRYSAANIPMEQTRDGAEVETKGGSTTPGLWDAKRQRSMTPFAKTPTMGSGDSECGSDQPRGLESSISWSSLFGTDEHSLASRAQTPIGFPWNYTPQPGASAEEEPQNGTIDDDDSSEYAVECMLETSSSASSSEPLPDAAIEVGLDDTSAKLKKGPRITREYIRQLGLIFTPSFCARLDEDKRIIEKNAKKGLDRRVDYFATNIAFH